jgi:hypothetical protein
MKDPELAAKLDAFDAELKEVNEHIAKRDAENAELKARVTALEPKPEFVSDYVHEKFDPMAFVRLPRDAVNALVANVGDDLMRDIVGDHSPNLRRR